MEDGPSCFPQGFTCPVVLWIILVAFSFQLQGYYLLWRSFPTLFIYDIASMLYVRNPNEVNFIGLACSAFARRYLRNRFFFLFLQVLRCFSSPGYPRMTMDSSCGNAALPALSFLIRKSMGRSLFAAHHGLSQLIASFFGVWCLGIHPVLLLA